MNTIRQRRTVGAVFAVPLGDGTMCFALSLPDADFAFFDLRTRECTFPAELLSKPVLFRVGVHKSAYANGRWLKVSKVKVPNHLLEAKPMFIQDALHPDRFEIYLAGNIRPSTRQECEGLDRAAVWEPEHVEDRLRDHYAGVPNKWVELLRLK
jgi:hypothetical protein